MSKAANIVEYLIFAFPYWGVLPMGAVSMMWLIANKSSWHKIPWSIAFMALTLAGLLALTRVLLKRMRGEARISGFEAAFLLGGLVACLFPMLWYFAVERSAPGGAVGWAAYSWSLALAWPAPIYLHWMVSGLTHRPAMKS